jgi:predicted transcriptional regulator
LVFETQYFIFATNCQYRSEQMKVKDIVKLLDAEILCGSDKADYTIEVAFASDLMSDVLTLKSSHVLLITGLTNMQTIRTAEMSDISCVIFARNKKVTEEILELARENELIVLACRYSVFKTCGLLYNAGVKPIF